MKILFCDLCNESVPQSDLDLGRATMRKGRVVCGKCERLMSTREEPPAPGFGASHSGSGPFGSPSTTGPTSAPVMQMGAATPGTHAAQHHGHHPHHPQPRGSRGGSGVAVGLFAVALTAGATFWLTERSERLNTDANRRFDELRRTQLDNDSRAMDRSNEVSSRILALEEALRQDADADRKATESRFAEAQKKQETALASLGDVNTAINELKAALSNMERHEQELQAAGQRASQMETRAAAIELAMADLRKQLETRPAPGPGTPGGATPTPVGTPAWMGLVQQLESPNNGERWIAVSSLGETRDPAVAEYLLPRLKDVDIFVRMATARVLGDLKSLKSAGALIEALKDQDSSVREAAYASLCAVSSKSFPFDAHQEPGDRAKRIKVWEDWWKKTQEEGGGS